MTYPKHHQNTIIPNALLSMVYENQQKLKALILSNKINRLNMGKLKKYLDQNINIFNKSK